MSTSHEIFYNEGRLCITLARGENLLKGYDSPQNKQSALLYHNAQMFEVDWQSLQMIGDRCCLVFMPNEAFDGIPVDASELCSSLRPKSLSILKNLSHAFEAAGNRLYWNMDSLPLSNILIFKNGDILLLSDQMGDALDRFEEDNLRHHDKTVWFAHNCIEGYGKVQYLFQLLYFTLSGVAPFEAEEVRENRFRALPLGLLFPPAGQKTEELFATVDKAISDNRKFQFSVRKPFAFFRQIADAFSEVPESELKTGDNPGLAAYHEKLVRNANRRIFFRKKGVKTFLITLGVAAVLGIIAFYIWRAVKPPATRYLDEEQMIVYYYDAMNRLDAADMSEPLKYGYDGPDFVEVSTLYVTSTVQKNYEGQSLVVDPRTWIENGMGSIPASSIIYGVTDVSVVKIDEDTYRATIHLWSSQNYLDDSDVLMPENGIYIYEYVQVNDFSFRTRSTWREVTEISQVSLDLVNTYLVNYI